MSIPLFDFAKTQQYSIKELNKEQATRIQKLLKGAGYEITVDGIVGAETLKVFGQFKLDNYLEHPLLLGATTYDDLMQESNERQAPIKPSDETQPLIIEARKVKKVNVAGFGSVHTSTKIAGNFTWGQATHDGTRAVYRSDHAENIRKLAVELSKFQKYVDKPFRITSWYRPEPWNSRAGGASRSTHLDGRGVDVVVVGVTGRELGEMAKEFGWNGGLGIYTKYPHILHLDIATRRSWGF